MARTYYKEDQIIAKLRQAELLFAEGKTKEQVCKTLEVSPITLGRWKSKYGHMTRSEAKKLRDLEKENERLKKIVAEQAIDLSVLKEFAKGNL